MFKFRKAVIMFAIVCSVSYANAYSSFFGDVTNGSGREVAIVGCAHTFGTCGQ
jgi:hypothetical protein